MYGNGVYLLGMSGTLFISSNLDDWGEITIPGPDKFVWGEVVYHPRLKLFVSISSEGICSTISPITCTRARMASRGANIRQILLPSQTLKQMFTSATINNEGVVFSGKWGIVLTAHVNHEYNASITHYSVNGYSFDQQHW